MTARWADGGGEQPRMYRGVTPAPPASEKCTCKTGAVPPATGP